MCVLTVKESRGWEVAFTTPTLERVPQRIALNARIAGSQGGPILAAVVGEWCVCVCVGGGGGGGGGGGCLLYFCLSASDL